MAIGRRIGSMMGATLLVVSCGGGGDGTAVTDAGTAGDVLTDEAGVAYASCGDPALADHYVAGMEKDSQSMRFKAKLLASDPGPPVKGLGTWTVEIDDATGAPKSGLAVKVSTYMPLHGHSASVVPTVMAMSAPGQYSVTNIDFFMVGLWQITLDITDATAGTHDTAVYLFCVDR